jgi:hypothetical protein
MKKKMTSVGKESAERGSDFVKEYLIKCLQLKECELAKFPVS